MFYSFVFYAFGVWGAMAQARLDQLFRTWEQAKRDTWALDVRLVVEKDDRLLLTKSKREGRFQLLRISKDSYLGRFELGEPMPVSNMDSVRRHERCTYLLFDRDIYWLDPLGRNTASKFHFAEGELMAFLERFFYPPVRLLNKEKVRHECRLGIFRVDQHYTIIHLKQRAQKQPWWFGNEPADVFIALEDQDTDSVPKGMICAFQDRSSPAGNVTTVNVISWRTNKNAKLAPADFTRPETWPGWEVRPSPFEVGGVYKSRPAK